MTLQMFLMENENLVHVAKCDNCNNILKIHNGKVFDTINEHGWHMGDQEMASQDLIKNFMTVYCNLCGEMQRFHGTDA